MTVSHQGNEEVQDKVKQALDRVLEALPMLRLDEAHREYILRQEVEWHKGKALEWIIKTHFVPALYQQVIHNTEHFHQHLYQAGTTLLGH